MRALKAAVIVMAVLIVAGVAVLGVTIAQRLSGAAPAAAVAALLDEPSGTRISGIAAVADRLAVQLQGGGVDRVVVLDTRSGRVLLRAALAR